MIEVIHGAAITPVLTLEAAIEMAQSGDIIYFPAGVYDCPETLQLTDRVSLQGDGKVQIITPRESQ